MHNVNYALMPHAFYIASTAWVAQLALIGFWRLAILGCRSFKHTYRTRQQAEMVQLLLEQRRNGETMCVSTMVGKVRDSSARFLLDTFDELSGGPFKEILLKTNDKCGLPKVSPDSS